jgi:hypothetical protein
MAILYMRISFEIYKILIEKYKFKIDNKINIILTDKCKSMDDMNRPDLYFKLNQDSFKEVIPHLKISILDFIEKYIDKKIEIVDKYD